MKVFKTAIAGALVIEPNVFGDDRGFFMETFQAARYRDVIGGEFEFLQDNYSRSAKNVLRGLHFQKTKPQGKLVRVVMGEVYDVAVDLRLDSATYGQCHGVRLNAENKLQFWLPPGLAHGFVLTRYCQTKINWALSLKTCFKTMFQGNVLRMAFMFRLLVTGQKGQIGQSIKARIDHQKWAVLLTDIGTLDITNAKQVAAVFNAFKPDVVINAAGYTDVDRAEQDASAAESVNAYGSYLLAIQCHHLGALLIHFSTDYIFSGQGHGRYVETDTPAPLNVYGRTKLQGEQYIKAYLSHYIIVRTSWVFSEFGPNFVTAMLALSSDTTPIRIVNDQFGCPTYAGDIANLVLDIAKDYTVETHRYQCGDYNFCGDSCDSGVSWFDFACAIFAELDKYQPGEQGRNLTGVTSEAYASIATRPKNGILNCHKISSIFRPSDWRRKLRHVIETTMA